GLVVGVRRAIRGVGFILRLRIGGLPGVPVPLAGALEAFLLLAHRLFLGPALLEPVLLDVPEEFLIIIRPLDLLGCLGRSHLLIALPGGWLERHAQQNYSRNDEQY